MASLALFVCFFGVIVMLVTYVRRFVMDFGENVFILGREERTTNSALCVGCFILFTIGPAVDAKASSSDITFVHYLELIAMMWAVGQAWGCMSMRRRIELNYARQLVHAGEYRFDMYRPVQAAPTFNAPRDPEQKLLEYRPQMPNVPDENYAFDPRRFDRVPNGDAKQ